jgi:membrane fusion protein (multidrug efflux system)
MRKRTVIILAVTLLLLTLLFFLTRGSNGEGEKLSQESPVEAAAAMVEVEKVLPRDILEFIESNGIIKAWQEAEISPEVSGTVKTIFAEVGDELKTGDPIFKLNDELLKLQVEKARALVTQLEGNYLSSKRDLSRKEALFKDGVVADLDLDLARAKEKADRGMLDGAKVSLKIARRDLRESTIRSPIKGILAERLIDIGTTVTPQEKVASVVDIGKVRIKIGVSGKEISRIKNGQQVSVSVDAFPLEEYQGRVFSVGSKASEGTLTFPVEIEIANDREPVVKPGMVARPKIQTGNHSQAIVIAQEVILDEGLDSFVFVVRDGLAKKVKVTTGFTIDSQVIVKDGLSSGDLLVTVGFNTISEGIKVRMKNDLP